MGRKAPPVVAVTGALVASVNDADVNLFLRQAQSLGASATIQKPFNSAELVLLVQSLLEA